MAGLSSLPLTLTLLVSSSALCQTDAELVKARKLYSQGLTQEAAGDWAGALATFEDVARIKATAQVRFHLARCKEHLGRYNEALGGYRMAEYEVEQAGAKEKALVDEIRKAREGLEAKIPRVTIVRGKNAEAIKIELDGVILGDTQLGQPITLDPGPHTVVGVVAADKRFKRALNVAEGDTVRVVLDVPDDLVTAEAPPPEKSEEPKPKEASKTHEPEEHSPTAPSPSPSASPTPWIIGGLGVASLAASAVFYALRSKAEDELDQGCLGRTCPDTLESTQKRGETYAALSGVTFGLGVVGVGASALMLLGRSRTPAPATSGFLTVSPRGAGLGYAGRF